MADLPTLLRRLSEVNSAPVNSSPEAVADAIRINRLEGAMCWRDPWPDGKALNFQRFYEAVFQQQLDGKPLKEGKRG